VRISVGVVGAIVLLLGTGCGAGVASQPANTAASAPPPTAPAPVLTTVTTADPAAPPQHRPTAPTIATAPANNTGSPSTNKTPCEYLTLELAQSVLPQLPPGTKGDTGDGNCAFTSETQSLTYVRQRSNQPTIVAAARQSFARRVASCTPATNCDPANMSSVPATVGDQAVCFDTLEPTQNTHSLVLWWQRASSRFELDLTTSSSQASCAVLAHRAFALNAAL
jgi:hypothetical protein